MKPTYTEEEANEILHRAIERMPVRAEMTREQLESVAAEVGVTSEALKRAEADLAAERVKKVERRAFVAGRRRGLLKHSLFFTSVMFVAFVVAAKAGDRGARMMFLACLLAWGMGLTVHAFDVVWTRGEKFEADFTKWRIQRRARELAEAELRRLQ